MAGINPGMIIKVAADIREAVSAMGDVVKATTDVQTSTEDVQGAYDALDIAMGTFAANAASALFGLAFDAVTALGKELWGVVDAALGLSKAYDEFKDAISDGITESGAFKAGIDALSTSILGAFGGTREQLVKTIVDLIEKGTIWTLEFAADLITLGEYGARGLAALIVPIDALLLAMGFLTEKVIGSIATLLELAAKAPGVGSAFDGMATTVRAAADATKGWKDETYNQMKAHQELVSGGGAFLDWTGKATDVLRGSADAMTAKKEAALAAAPAINAVTDANAGLVLGSGEAAVALYEEAAALQEMDEWSRAIKNTDPYAYLKQGMERTLPPLESTTTALRETSRAAIDMSGDVRFAAETVETAAATVQTAALSWSEAMAAVGRGEGTMTGTIGPAVKPDYMSNVEWDMAQSNPTAWSAIYGYDWQKGQNSMRNAWSMGSGFTGATSGTTVNQSVTVNTVAGDKQAIAAVVKDALADDWRTSGVRG